VIIDDYNMIISIIITVLMVFPFKIIIFRQKTIENPEYYVIIYTNHEYS